MSWIASAIKWIMLVYGAYHPTARPLVLSVAGLSKLVFIASFWPTAGSISPRQGWPLGSTP